MQTFDMIVGQKYTYLHNPGNESTCVLKGGPNGEQAVLKGPTGNLFILTSGYNWNPAKKKGVLFVNVYPDGNSYTYSVREVADKVRYREGKAIACIEVPWTEGQGL